MPPEDKFADLAHSIFGIGLEVGPGHPQHPHGSNILKKAGDEAGDPGGNRFKLITELGANYAKWRTEAMALPCSSLDSPQEFVDWQANAYNQYRDLLDQERFDTFDSRFLILDS